MAILDQHCAVENSKFPWRAPGGMVVRSEYNFLYVPVDFRYVPPLLPVHHPSFVLLLDQLRLYIYIYLICRVCIAQDRVQQRLRVREHDDGGRGVAAPRVPPRPPLGAGDGLPEGVRGRARAHPGT